MKEVNLEKILFNEIDKFRKDLPEVAKFLYSNEEMRNSPEWNYYIASMKEACKQILELAAENATTTLHKSGKQIVVVTPILEPQYYEKGNGDLVPQGYAQVGTRTQLKYENELVVVDKDSILNTINQII